MLEREETLVIIKPHVKIDYQDTFDEVVIDILETYTNRCCLQIWTIKKVLFTPEQMREFYKEHQDRDFYQKLIESMVMGPSVAMVIKGTYAISIVRDINGPTNVLDCTEKHLRGKYGRKEAWSPYNALHASANTRDYSRERHVIRYLL